MPAQRVSMRKIREVLRLTFARGLSKRQVAPIAGVSATTAPFCDSTRAGNLEPSSAPDPRNL